MKTRLKTVLRACFTFSFLTVAMAAQAGSYPDLPQPIKFGSGALIGNTVYVGLGSAGNRFYALDFSRQQSQWQPIAEFPGGERQYAVAAALNGKLYIFGGLQQGENGLQVVNDAYRYDPRQNNWAKLDTGAPRGIVGAGSAVYQEKIYLLGGNNPEILGAYLHDYAAADHTEKEAVQQAYFEQRPQDYFFTAELLSYQPSDNRWRNEGSLPFSARTCAAVVGQGETVLVVSGAVKPGLNTANTQQGLIGKQRTEWKKLSDLPAVVGKTAEGLSGAAAGYSNGHYLIAGGSNFPGAQQQFRQGKLFAHQGLSRAWHNDIYTLKNGRWKRIGELTNGVSHAVTVSYDNNVLLIGGESHGGKALSAVQVLRYDGNGLIIE
ncbi:N-acetylneuraminic acid mutarotase [Chelonobacter oris]|uniref:N-acetylneuraminate epimerase n=1 Tax=Chelonobacter oris TaxID=505317 RepID=UPI002A25B89D|nr:N-acetylneuraminic acid mutarotase [Chelonobacter oris]